MSENFKKNSLNDGETRKEAEILFRKVEADEAKDYFTAEKQLESETKSDRINKVLRLFEIGMDSEDCIGYHGTSLEAIQFMVDSGFLPGREYDPKEKSAKYFYFSPKKSKFSSNPVVNPQTFYWIEENNLLQDTSIYAENIAKGHFIMKKLGLDIGDWKAEQIVRHIINPQYKYMNPDSVEYLQKLGVKEKDLKAAVKRAKGRKGIVIGLNKNLLEHHTLQIGDDPGDGEMRIVIPEGFKLDFLSGLEPMGEEEWDYFEKLQKELKRLNKT